MSRPCTVDGCKGLACARGLCTRHYQTQRAARLLGVACSVPDCDRQAFCRGLCRGHYARATAGKDLGGALAAKRRGNAILACRVPAGVLRALRQAAAAKQQTANQIAAEVLSDWVSSGSKREG